MNNNGGQAGRKSTAEPVTNGFSRDVSRVDGLAVSRLAWSHSVHEMSTSQRQALLKLQFAPLAVNPSLIVTRNQWRVAHLFSLSASVLNRN